MLSIDREDGFGVVEIEALDDAEAEFNRELEELNAKRAVDGKPPITATTERFRQNYPDIVFSWEEDGVSRSVHVDTDGRMLAAEVNGWKDENAPDGRLLVRNWTNRFLGRAESGTPAFGDLIGKSLSSAVSLTEADLTRRQEY